MKLDSKQYNSGLLKMDVCPSQQPKYGKWRSHPRFTRNIIIHRTLSTNLPSNKPQPSIMHSGEQEQTPTSFQIIENPKYMRSKKAGSVNYLNIIWNAVATAARVGFKGSMVGCEGSMVGCDGCEGNMVGCDGFKSGIGRLRRLRGWNYRLRQLNSLCPMVAIDFHNCGSHVAPLKARFRNVGCNNWTDFAQKSVSKKKKVTTGPWLSSENVHGPMNSYLPALPPHQTWTAEMNSQLVPAECAVMKKCEDRYQLLFGWPFWLQLSNLSWTIEFWVIIWKCNFIE